MKLAREREGGEAADDLESLELDLLLSGIARRWGYDFRDYAPASLRRRVRRAMQREGVRNLSALQERVLHDVEALQRFLASLSVNVTGMFRDPQVFRALRRQVLPMLRTYPYVRIWDAGCSTGEEAYSLAILLAEEGLLEKSRIYATDINANALSRARSCAFPIDRMQEFTRNYIEAGGDRAFSDYYTVRHELALFRPWIAKNIVFAQHNLATDASFNEFSAVLCRNVLIYFEPPLQERVHRLLYESLKRFGILGLG